MKVINKEMKVIIKEMKVIKVAIRSLSTKMIPNTSQDMKIKNTREAINN